ncbi:MAG: HAMP domain-containing protein [Burkholderiales bacterium]|nr:HAMP domain-containing protein [Burkholderiales bacterium]
MTTPLHTIRRPLISRGMKLLIAVILLMGAVMLYLLSSASSNTPLFAADLRLLLLLGVVLVLMLMGLVGYQLLALRRRLKARLFGAKLTLRLVLLFALVALLPGALVYAVSVQFLNKSIESWFDVRVEKALEGGLAIGRTTLDNMLRELAREAESMAVILDDASPRQRARVLNALREQGGLSEVGVFTADGRPVAFSSADAAALMPSSLPAAAARQIRLQQAYRDVRQDSGEALTLVVAVPLNTVEGTLALQLIQPVAAPLAQDMSTVQTLYQDYQEIALARGGLKRLYGLSLTLSLLLALLSALVLAILFSESLTAPLVMLAAGTRAVAQGDFSQRHPVRSHDELGVLTESFNTMTRQLADARAAALGNQKELEAANAYLETILAKLSAGVLSLDREGRLRSANPSASGILGIDLDALIGVTASEWATRAPQLREVGEAVQAAIVAARPESWEKQLQLDDGKVLLMRGSALQVGSDAGSVVVFDDITRLLQAQRYAAWGEVARRLAHEIKNPLTPIQLSAERLEHRLSDKLDPADAQMLARSTRTIVSQVSQLKGMVDAFSQYARTPETQLQPLDLNQLVRDVLTLYEGQKSVVTPSLDDALPPVLGDAARLRQVIHNLLQNAEQAVSATRAARVGVRTVPDGTAALLEVIDNGPGFPPEMLARAFEPYVTTKVKGTGLGLAIVKKIIEEHNGSIQLSNAGSSGAQVRIRLPLALAPGQAHTMPGDVRVGQVP